MSDPGPKSPPVVRTRVARAGFTDHELWGHRVYGDLLGRESYTGLMALAILGRRLPAEAVAVLDDMAVVMAIAEPRIWPLKVSRLVASFGRTVPAALAGALCFESDLIGPWTSRAAAEWLSDMRARLGDEPDAGALHAELARALERQGRLVGFGVPFRPEDERVVALARCIRSRGRDGLPHWRLATRLWQALRERRGVEPNISAALAAAGLDLGLRPDELAPLTVALLHSIFWANAVEGARQAPAVLRRLPPETVGYAGPAPRKSPRAG